MYCRQVKEVTLRRNDVSFGKERKGEGNFFQRRLQTERLLGKGNSWKRAWTFEEEGSTKGVGGENGRFYLEPLTSSLLPRKGGSGRGKKLEGCRVSKGENFPPRERGLVPVIR